MDHLLSVIVPVYNTEQYLRRCIDSILVQTMKDFELILVDDGSTDSSGSVCDEYMDEDKRIRVIHQENQGLAVARNRGIDMAAGVYILFIDSDDYYANKTCLSQLMEKAEADHLDMICFNYIREKGTKRGKPCIRFPDKMEGVTLKTDLVKANAYQSSACFRVVRNEIVIKNRMFFEAGRKSEDIKWSADLLRHCHKIGWLDESFYIYTIREGSITRSVSLDHVEDLLSIVKKLSKESLDIKDRGDTREAYCSYIAFQYATLLINGKIARPKISKDQGTRIKELRPLLEWGLDKYTRMINTCMHLFGYRLTAFALSVYYKYLR